MLAKRSRDLGVGLSSQQMELLWTFYRELAHWNPSRQSNLHHLARRSYVTQLPHLPEATNTHRVHNSIHLAALLPPDPEDRSHYAM